MQKYRFFNLTVNVNFVRKRTIIRTEKYCDGERKKGEGDAAKSGGGGGREKNCLRRIV
jgi:hypothetical protein